MVLDISSSVQRGNISKIFLGLCYTPIRLLQSSPGIETKQYWVGFSTGDDKTHGLYRASGTLITSTPEPTKTKLINVVIQTVGISMANTKSIFYLHKIVIAYTITISRAQTHEGPTIQGHPACICNKKRRPKTWLAKKTDSETV